MTTTRRPAALMTAPQRLTGDEKHAPAEYSTSTWHGLDQAALRQRIAAFIDGVPDPAR
ncbi:hypothetical protein HC028_21485 [Planosporangium flavigriseum]|uniref:hypothetical protein n=1 Tax=Planosporangium flavigriseum TaxID=373681 RepID=UPI00143A432C|nr:hypothetical protein [Planosporangium flavigriseum]NJC67054.1 hypothetical protein [Planosporangium flavigriseum]